MRKYNFILIPLFFLVVSSPLLAQSETQDPNTDITPNGIYTTFTNFVRKNPVPGVTVYFKDPERIENRVWFGSVFIKLKSDLKLNTSSKNNMRNLCWGFSDGENVYINANNYVKVSYHRFTKILYLGKKYSYFVGMRNVMEKTAGFVGGVIGSIVGLDYYLMDMDTGKCTLVEGRVIDNFLSHYDDDLYAKYQEEKENLSDEEKMKYVEKIDQLINK